MCFTAQDSLNAYLINLIGSIVVFLITTDRQIRLLCLFFLFVGQMQLFDYIFWLNNSCNLLNKITTKTAIIFNHLQPIILVLLMFIYGFNVNNFTQSIFIAYVLMSLLYNYDALKNVDCTKSENNLMKWKWNNRKLNGFYYALFLLLLVLVGLNLPNRRIGILFSFLSVLSFFVATKRPILNISIGRIWCYYASLFPLLLITIAYYYK